MKFLVLLSALLFTSFVFAEDENCLQFEAQFIGHVKSTTAAKSPKGPLLCTYQIEFHQFSPSMVCPLFAIDAQTANILDDSCNIEVGSDISGILVLDLNSKFRVE